MNAVCDERRGNAFAVDLLAFLHPRKRITLTRP
jgi:hypothetical protein